MEIAIVVYVGFDELDAIGPYEVFQNAAEAGADCTISLRTIDAVGVVEASHGLRIEPDGRPAVTHGGALDDLRATPAEVVKARVVDDDDVLTAGGVTSGLDLAFHIVEREFGDDVAKQVRTEMEYEDHGSVYEG